MLKVHFKDLGEFRSSMSHPHGDGVSKEGEGGRSSMRSQVGMAALEEVDCHEDGEEVHVGHVKLEVDISWAEMVAGGHDPNH